MATGQVSLELEVGAPASLAWDVYGSLKLPKAVEEALPDQIQKIELVQGDGGEGTVLRITFSPGGTGPSGQTEKFTKVDDEKRVKDVEVIEGGLLDLGISLYRVRYEIIEVDTSSCIIKTSIDYELKEDASIDAASLVSIEQYARVADFVKKQLLSLINK